MVKNIMEGVEVTVEVAYQPNYSNPMQKDFMFAYLVKVTNNNKFPIKLERYRLTIFTGESTEYKEIPLDNVAGMNPIINYFDTYTYSKGYNSHTECARIYSYYVARNMDTNELFEVTLPTIDMYYPQKLN